jgi:LacI family transcriptional regulator
VYVGLSAVSRVARTVVDNAAVAQLAYEHFYARGWRRFACVTLPDARMFAERVQAFQARCRADDLPCSLLSANNLTPRQLRAVAPCAVFAVQDGLGADGIAAAQRAGLAVPEQFAVIGVDDVDLICEALPVPLASVDTDQEGLGVAAAERLARLLAGEADDGVCHRHPPRHVVVRASADVLGTEHAGLRAALALVQRDPACGVRAMAAAAGLSAQGLDKACRREFGLSPGVLLRQARLQRAERALASGATVAEAAQQAGIGSASTLCATLRRTRGVTPATWRARWQR